MFCARGRPGTAPGRPIADFFTIEHTRLEGAQRPNLKSEDSGFRHRFSKAKVSLWMCENSTGHEESHADRLVGETLLHAVSELFSA